MTLGIFLLCLGATARITRLITDDRLTSPVRARAIRRYGPDHPLPYWLSCPWCASPYIAATAYTLGWFYGHTPVFVIATAALTASYLIGTASTHLDGRTD